MDKYKGTISTLGGLLLAALGLVALAEPASACEPVHQLRREPTTPTPTPGPGGDLNPPAILCWSGPCKKRHGVLDTMGKYAVLKPTGDHRVDFLQMDIYDENDVLLQTLVAPDGAPVCGPPAGTVDGCTERYKVPNVKACPLGTGPNCPGQKVIVTLNNMEEVNEVTTSGGGITLADGQFIPGVARRRFWLSYEVCCPDFGDFGDPGDLIRTHNEYTVQIAGLCETREPRQTKIEEIPDRTFPCEP